MRSSVAAPELLSWRRQQLQAGGRAAELDWLLDLEGGVPWQTLQQLQLHPEAEVSLSRGLDELAALWQRYLQGHEPLQYLVGRCPWRDLELQVGPGVLIPRQETELMVDLAAELMGTAADAAIHWADLGTGSGCLAAALALRWPLSKGWAVDVSEEALEVAQGNLQQLDLQERVQLRKGQWWEPLRPWFGSLQLVVSNPPYIPTGVWSQLEPVVRDHEPSLALDGGHDGLDALRQIVATAPEALAEGGTLLLEHHHDQSDAVLELLSEAGLEHSKAHPDLEGVRRFASARRGARP